VVNEAVEELDKTCRRATLTFLFCHSWKIATLMENGLFSPNLPRKRMQIFKTQFRKRRDSEAKWRTATSRNFDGVTHLTFPLTFRFRYRSKSRSTLAKNWPPRSRVLLLAYSRNSNAARLFLARIVHLPRATSDDRLVVPAEAPVSFMRASAPYAPAITQIKLRWRERERQDNGKKA